ncbi:MAG TPA: hypothetical protein VIJ64_13450 [Candidatus Lustribacter sp.]
MFRTLLVLVLASLALGGCGRAEAAAPKAAAASPNLPCSLPYGTRVALLSPVPGSAGVAAGNAPVLVVASRALPKTVNVVATDTKGTSSAAAALELTAAPAQVTRAPWPDPVYYRAAGMALRAHRHYTLALDDIAQNGCAPYVPITGGARFST